jgi:hypothetical protein
MRSTRLAHLICLNVIISITHADDAAPSSFSPLVLHGPNTVASARSVQHSNLFVIYCHNGYVLRWSQKSVTLHWPVGGLHLWDFRFSRRRVWRWPTFQRCILPSLLGRQWRQYAYFDDNTRRCIPKGCHLRGTHFIFIIFSFKSKMGHNSKTKRPRALFTQTSYLCFYEQRTPEKWCRVFKKHPVHNTCTLNSKQESEQIMESTTRYGAINSYERWFSLWRNVKAYNLRFGLVFCCSAYRKTIYFFFNSFLRKFFNQLSAKRGLRNADCLILPVTAAGPVACAQPVHTARHSCERKATQ